MSYVSYVINVIILGEHRGVWQQLLALPVPQVLQGGADRDAQLDHHQRHRLQRGQQHRGHSAEDLGTGDDADYLIPLCG